MLFNFGWAENSNVRMSSNISCMIRRLFARSTFLSRCVYNSFYCFSIRKKKKQQNILWTSKSGSVKKAATLMPNKHAFFHGNMNMACVASPHHTSFVFFVSDFMNWVQASRCIANIICYCYTHTQLESETAKTQIPTHRTQNELISMWKNICVCTRI